MKLTHPLISCICITNNRPQLLKRAVACFESQNYPNKELVVSYPKKDVFSPKIIRDALQNEELKILQIEREDEQSLGNARNTAINKCFGDYICIWDDDDWYHPSRISYQFNSMQISGQRYQASVLSRILLYDSTTKEAYYSFSYTWDGTILCRKEILLQNQYADTNKGEDSHVITFLSGRKLLYEIDTAPFLYIYIYHGENTWNYAHFENFINKSQVLDKEANDRILLILNN
ncbi:glycosyltransferase involved in cell wall biosynthesis [Pedobacter cryoconitis]|uniref:Glycosyltransferase involved in cell wall biosynthesis n=1 Tax=Pedobacter cryoconitis TaxID=188932 RepID=A0A7W9E1M2_9SPHI|nr:glycosyltransferase [Pedobacter cryoconitis]MBB5637825.1 glycosyltransferase involved in cell wall biosynthesis [Pedobacter cryoconitis]MBB6270419.1 glycosyltransferase involved in cell wall biosynthesis [Pedobacter cryoconitis]